MYIAWVTNWSLLMVEFKPIWLTMEFKLADEGRAVFGISDLHITLTLRFKCDWLIICVLTNHDIFSIPLICPSQNLMKTYFQLKRKNEQTSHIIFTLLLFWAGRHSSRVLL